MGDMADYYIEQAQNAGEWSWPRGGVLPRQTSRSRVYGPPVACNRCGGHNVYWQHTHAGYKLHSTDDLQPHVCPTTADGFGDTDV